MTYADLTDFLDDSGLHVTIRGKDYLIPSPDAETGLKLQALAQIGAKVQQGVQVPEGELKSIQLDDDDERKFTDMVLGSSLEQFKADGLDWVQLSRLAQYAFTHFALSPETARKALEAGVYTGKGQAPAAAQNRETRRATPKAQQGSSGSRTRTAPKPTTSGTRSGAIGRS